MAAQNGEGVYGSGAGVVTPLAHKLSQNGPLVKDSAGKPRSGVFYAGNASLVSGKANMSYDVAPFEAAICRARTKGTSFPTNDAVVNVTTTAAPGSNSRIDIIYFQQKEISEGDASTAAVVGVVQGVAASSPVPPALPGGAIELARAVVAAGITATTSATITQTAPFTAPLGSAVPFRNSTERDAAGTFASFTKCVLLDTGAEFAYSSGWKSASGAVCVLGKSVSQSLTTSLTAVSWDVEVSDAYGMHNNVANDSRVTAPGAGVYEVTVFVYNNKTTGVGVVQARKNGTTDIQGSFTRRTGTADAAIPLDKTFPVVLAAGDYIEIMASHSAAAGTVGGGTTA